MDSYFAHKHNPGYSRKSLLFSSIFFIGILFAVFSLKSNISSPFQNSLSQFDLDQEQFKSYMVTYNKNYPTPEEFSKRFEKFRTNLAHFKEFNSQGHTWTKGVNKFTDMTNEEFRQIYSRPIKHVETDHIKELEVTATITPWDWRDFPGVLTPIKSQHTCGNCYAFATVAAIESAWAISGHELISLSQQQITDCSVEYGNMGCNGGNFLSTYAYVYINGLVSQQYYPFVNHAGPCKKSVTWYPSASISGWVQVPPNNYLQLILAVYQGPVSVPINSDTLQHYSGGIFTGDGCDTVINHAVVIVGFDYSEADDMWYWIVRNSWGTEWGDGGYFYIEMITASGPGVCGIQQDGFYPII